MIAANPDWLDARRINAVASFWQRKGLIPAQTAENIRQHYPEEFYSPNLFVRIGLAVFGAILLLAAAGLLFLMFDVDASSGVVVLSLFLAAAWLFVLEWWIIRQRHHFGSGLDDVLLYGSVLAIGVALGQLLPYDPDGLGFLTLMLPVLVAGSIRYLDRLLTLVALCFAGAILFLVLKKLPQALLILPFAGMLFAASLYTLSRRWQARHDLRFWWGHLDVVELFGLVLFYASGNYWVLQQVASSFFYLETVPLGWFFWAFTMIMPAVYIGLGLWRKDRLMLNAGLAAVIVAVFTFRYYFHVLPLYWAATALGAALFAAAGLAIRYLRRHPGAFTYEEDDQENLLLDVEGQLIGQTFGNPAQPVAKPSFGGGQFGGSGAGGDF